MREDDPILIAIEAARRSVRDPSTGERVPTSELFDLLSRDEMEWARDDYEPLALSGDAIGAARALAPYLDAMLERRRTKVVAPDYWGELRAARPEYRWPDNIGYRHLRERSGWVVEINTIDRRLKGFWPILEAFEIPESFGSERKPRPAEFTVRAGVPLQKQSPCRV